MEATFGVLGFSVSLEHAWYRAALVLEGARAARQTRIGAEQPSDIGRLDYFVRGLNRWLPTDQDRLLWVDHWQTGQHGGSENAAAALVWRGLGETRSLQEAPGLLFEKQNWDEEDQVEVAPEQAEALGVLVGVVAMMMITRSYGWLISANSMDRIEFWEGHVFFHSEEREQVERAIEILDELGCVRWNK